MHTVMTKGRNKLSKGHARLRESRQTDRRPVKVRSSAKARAARWRNRQSVKGRAAQRLYRQSVKRREAQRRYQQSPSGRNAQRRYRQSAKGRATQRRYQQSSLGRETQRRYRQSSKGREAQYRYNRSAKGIDRQYRDNQNPARQQYKREWARRYRKTALYKEQQLERDHRRYEAMDRELSSPGGYNWLLDERLRRLHKFLWKREVQRREVQVRAERRPKRP